MMSDLREKAEAYRDAQAAYRASIQNLETTDDRLIAAQAGKDRDTAEAAFEKAANMQAVITLLDERDALAARVEELEKENADLRACSKIKPQEFDLIKRTEWARLAHEAWGYIQTCRNLHHGTDLDGRLHAMNGLKAMRDMLTETLPPRQAIGDHNDG